ncbi:MAG: ABC transporter ATP-binding protein [Kocuria sp.]|nr:ABC transporter ATP-binding protein [Kocuria sp.]
MKHAQTPSDLHTRSYSDTAIPWATGGQVLRVLSRSVAQYPLRMAGAVVALLGAAVCSLALPAVLGAFMDVMVGHSGGHWLVGDGNVARLAAVLLGAVVLGAACSMFGTIWSSGVADRAIASLREDAVSAALNRSQQRIERTGSGEVVARSSDDVAAVTVAINTALPSAVAAISAIVVTAGGMVAIHWSYAVVLVVVTGPVYYVAVRRYLREAPVLYAQERQLRAQRAGVVLDVVRGNADIRTYHAAGFMRSRLVGPSWSVSRMVVLTQIATTKLFGGVNLAEFLGMASLLGTTVVLLQRDAVTLGAATAAVLFFMQLYAPIGTALMLLDKLQAAATSLSRIVGLIQSTDADSSTADGRRTRFDRRIFVPSVAPLQSTAAPGEVIVEALRAGYGSKAVVHGVSFVVPHGSSVALVGASGAGKSTVASVVAGVREPASGVVRIGGQNLHRLTGSARTRRVALIAQEGYVFSTTLRQNLDIGRPGVSDRILWRCLEDVGLREWAESLPEGLDTRLGPGTTLLADHQAQQLALARAVVVDPAVVVLDEPSSRVGEEESRILEAAVRGVSQGRTSITIAHRLSQAKTCDKILVMKAGRVVEEGNHDQLLSAGGNYARLWEASGGQ